MERWEKIGYIIILASYVGILSYSSVSCAQHQGDSIYQDLGERRMSHGS